MSDIREDLKKIIDLGHARDFNIETVAKHALNVIVGLDSNCKIADGIIKDVKEMLEDHPETLDPVHLAEVLGLDTRTSCKSPGRNGCGVCDVCGDWGDAEHDRKGEDGLL